MARERTKGKKTVSAVIELTKENHSKAAKAKIDVGGLHISDGVNALLNTIDYSKVKL